MNTKAVAYYRRSTDMQETSLEQQREAVEAYAKQNGFEILRAYEDTGSGKGVESRASFLSMIEDSKSRRFQAVLVYDISRFGRMDSDEIGFYRHQLKTNGVQIFYTAEGLRNDGSMGDRMVRSLKQEMAHEYVRDLAQKIVRGLIHHTEHGFASGRIAPYGYRLMEVLPDGSPHLVYNEKGEKVPRVIRHEMKEHKSEKNNSVRLTPDPVHRKVIERIFHMADNDFGVRKICEILNRDGVPSPGKFKRVQGTNATAFLSGKWGTNTIWGIVRNPIYKGELVWNRSRDLTCFEWERKNGSIVVGEKRTKNGGFKRRRPESEWVRCPKAHEPIIQPKEFDRLQVKFKKRAYEAQKQHMPNVKYLLTNFIECGCCGQTLRADKEIKRTKDFVSSTNGKTYTRHEKVYRYYRCTSYKEKPGICERGLLMEMEPANTAVWSGIQRRLLAKDVVPKLTTMVKRIAEERLGGRGIELQQVQGEKKRAKLAIDRLLDALEAGFSLLVGEDASTRA